MRSPSTPTEVSPPAAGLTVADVARRYRLSPDKVRAWIARGELAAINTSSALCGKPRWVILPDALGAFERPRAGGHPRSHAGGRGRSRSTTSRIDCRGMTAAAAVQGAPVGWTAGSEDEGL